MKDTFGTSAEPLNLPMKPEGYKTSDHFEKRAEHDSRAMTYAIAAETVRKGELERCPPRWRFVRERYGGEWMVACAISERYYPIIATGYVRALTDDEQWLASSIPEKAKQSVFVKQKLYNLNERDLAMVDVTDHNVAIKGHNVRSPRGETRVECVACGGVFSDIDEMHDTDC